MYTPIYQKTYFTPYASRRHSQNTGIFSNPSHESIFRHNACHRFLPVRPDDPHRRTVVDRRHSRIGRPGAARCSFLQTLGQDLPLRSAKRRLAAYPPPCAKVRAVICTTRKTGNLPAEEYAIRISRPHLSDLWFFAGWTYGFVGYPSVPSPSFPPLHVLPEKKTPGFPASIIQ